MKLIAEFTRWQKLAGILSEKDEEEEDVEDNKVDDTEQPESEPELKPEPEVPDVEPERQPEPKGTEPKQGPSSPDKGPEIDRGVKPPPNIKPLPTKKPKVPASKEPTERKQVNREDAIKLIKNTRGKFFTVLFTKKDGSLRTMNARLGVKAYLKGGELPYNPEEKGLIPVFDIQKHEYRMINTRTLHSIKIGNNEYVIQ